MLNEIDFYVCKFRFDNTGITIIVIISLGDSYYLMYIIISLLLFTSLSFSLACFWYLAAHLFLSSLLDGQFNVEQIKAIKCP